MSSPVPSPKTLRLFEDQPYAQHFDARISAIAENALALDQTCFYPLGGGQPGDTGRIELAGGPVCRVLNTRKDRDNPRLIWHDLDAVYDAKVGSQVKGKLDWARRYAHMKMHTALHLLCSLIDAKVTGCNIASDKGRLDFDLEDRTQNKEDLTQRLKALIALDLDVTAFKLTEHIDEEIARLTKTKFVAPPVIDGAVRLVRIGQIDVQPCGGTHVGKLGEIGALEVVKIENKGRKNRRFTLAFAA